MLVSEWSEPAPEKSVASRIETRVGFVV